MTEVDLLAREDPKPGFKWPVSVIKPIVAPVENVWEAISMPGNLELCHPFCEKNPVEVWPGEGSRDQIYYLSGWIMERRFFGWFDGVGYDLEIARQGEKPSFVSWRIMPLDDQNCTLRISIYPAVLQNLPVMIRWLPHIVRVGPMLRLYLTSVVSGFEWYVTRGEAVPRNQFGSHPWFSVSNSPPQAT